MSMLDTDENREDDFDLARSAAADSLRGIIESPAGFSSSLVPLSPCYSTSQQGPLDWMPLEQFEAPIAAALARSKSSAALTATLQLAATVLNVGGAIGLARPIIIACLDVLGPTPRLTDVKSQRRGGRLKLEALSTLASYVCSDPGILSEPETVRVHFVPQTLSSRAKMCRCSFRLL